MSSSLANSSSLSSGLTVGSVSRSSSYLPWGASWSALFSVADVRISCNSSSGMSEMNRSWVRVMYLVLSLVSCPRLNVRLFLMTSSYIPIASNPADSDIVD